MNSDFKRYRLIAAGFLCRRNIRSPAPPAWNTEKRKGMKKHGIPDIPQFPAHTEPVSA